MSNVTNEKPGDGTRLNKDCPLLFMSIGFVHFSFVFSKWKKKLRRLLISIQSFCWASSPLISLSRFKFPVQSFWWKNNTFISTFPLIMIIIIISNKKKGFLEISYLILLIGLSFWRCIPRRRSYSSKRNTIATRDTYVSYGRCCQSS